MLSKRPARTIYGAAFITLVTGCNGSSWSSTPAINMQRAAVATTAVQRTGYLNGEIFSARNVIVRPPTVCDQNATTTFMAIGKTRGPYPGTFVATGKWTMFVFYVVRVSFAESFTIKSGTRTISGTIDGMTGVDDIKRECKTFGPANDFKYQVSGKGSGLATIKRIQSGSFNESLF